MIPLSTMKSNRNIECCNNTHQGVPRTGKQTSTCASHLGNASHVSCCQNDDCNLFIFIYMMKTTKICLTTMTTFPTLLSTRLKFSAQICTQQSVSLAITSPNAGVFWCNLTRLKFLQTKTDGR